MKTNRSKEEGGLRVEEEVILSVSEQKSSMTQMPKSIKVRTIVVIALVLIIAGIAYYKKGLVIAATVNGAPISRLAVIQALEKRSGKAALDSLINQKLIDNEASKKGIVISDDEISAELKTIETQVTSQGGTLDQALSAQNLTLEDLKMQIVTQKKMEKLLIDTVQVTDAEVTQYIKDSKVSIPNGQETEFKNQIKERLKQQKLQSGIQAFIGTLHSQAKINYFVKY